MHNRYRSGVPSGENVVVDTEASLLTAAGVDVVRHLRSSDEIDTMGWTQRATLPLRPFRSREDTRQVAALIEAGRPDVMHLHNPNPLISMAVVGVADRLGVPVVMTVHNHRHVCIKGVLRRDGRPCHDCEHRGAPWPGVLHSCYRDSFAQSAVTAGALVAHRDDYLTVSRFIAVSSSIRRSLLTTGIPAERITVHPHAVPVEALDGQPDPPAERTFLYLGRLDEDKGVGMLLDAWARHPAGALGRLRVVGAGPLTDQVRALAAGRSDVEAVGAVAPADVGALIGASTAVLIPSLVEESFGLVALESFARRRPVLSTGSGGLADVLDPSCSWTVPAGAQAWADALAAVTPAEAARRGAAGRARYERLYRPDVLTGQLIGIYRDVVAARRPGAAGSAADGGTTATAAADQGLRPR